MDVLSLDFDFFQNVTEDIIHCYPDGIDLSTEMSEIVWALHYATNKNQLLKISIRDEELYLAKQIINNQKENLPAMICNSHVKIYDFIKSQVSNEESVNIVHVDMHHDMFNDNPNLDCGNWISHLQQDMTVGLKWIANPITTQVYGISDLMLPFKKNGNFGTTLKQIQDKSFDAVFLCRSDSWTPPHLDKYFTDLCEVMKKRFVNISIEKDIDKPRIIHKEDFA